MIKIETKKDIADIKPGDIVNFDTYETDNITGEVIKVLDNTLIVETKDIPYLKVLF